MNTQRITGPAAEVAPIATPANLGGQHTEHSVEVWCDWAKEPSETNFDGTAHYCQRCGSTDHKPMAGAQ